MLKFGSKSKSGSSAKKTKKGQQQAAVDMNQLGMSNVLGVLFHDEEMDLFANLGDDNHFETMSASNYNSESDSELDVNRHRGDDKNISMQKSARNMLLSSKNSNTQFFAEGDAFGGSFVHADDGDGQGECFVNDCCFKKCKSMLILMFASIHFLLFFFHSFPRPRRRRRNAVHQRHGFR